MQTRTDGLDISFRPAHLTCEEQRRFQVVCLPTRKAEGSVEQSGGIDEGVPVHDAISTEFGILKARNHVEDAPLLGKCQIGLESDEVIACSERIFRPQLHDRPRSSSGSRILQSYRLQGTEAGSIPTCARDLLDRLASLEKILLLEIAIHNPICAEQGIDECLVFPFIHGCIEIISRTIFISALAEDDRTVERISGHDRRRGIIESKGVRIRHAQNGLRQRIGRKRSGCNDQGIARRGLGVHVGRLAPLEIDERVLLYLARDQGGKRLPIDRERSTCSNAVLTCGIEYERAERPQLLFEHPGGTRRIEALEGVRAYEFRAIRCGMHGRLPCRPHFDKSNRDPAGRELQRSLASCKACSEYVDDVTHG